MLLCPVFFMHYLIHQWPPGKQEKLRLFCFLIIFSEAMEHTPHVGISGLGSCKMPTWGL